MLYSIEGFSLKYLYCSDLISSIMPKKGALKHCKWDSLYLHQNIDQDAGTYSSVCLIKRVYIGNVSKQTCGSHEWIILLSLMEPKICNLLPYHSAILMDAKMLYLTNRSNFLYSPTKTTYPPQCFSWCIVIFRACLIIPTMRKSLILIQDVWEPTCSLSSAYKRRFRCRVFHIQQ